MQDTITTEKAKCKLEFLKKAYQKLIDEKVDSGKLVGDGVRGEWEAETPLDEVYKDMIESLDLAIKALEQQPRDCKTCKHSKDGKCAYTEECHTCMWENQYEPQPCEKSEQSDENNELLSSDERANVLNAINDMLEEKGFDLEVGGYEDTNGVIFDVMLVRR